jgi:hypothetical protein
MINSAQELVISLEPASGASKIPNTLSDHYTPCAKVIGINRGRGARKLVHAYHRDLCLPPLALR